MCQYTAPAVIGQLGIHKECGRVESFVVQAKVQVESRVATFHRLEAAEHFFLRLPTETQGTVTWN